MKTTRRGLFRSVFAAAALPYIPQPVARGVSLLDLHAFEERYIMPHIRKIGETINVRRPARFIATNGRPLVLNEWYGVDFEFDESDFKT